MLGKSSGAKQIVTSMCQGKTEFNEPEISVMQPSRIDQGLYLRRTPSCRLGTSKLCPKVRAVRLSVFSGFTHS